MKIRIEPYLSALMIDYENETFQRGMMPMWWNINSLRPDPTFHLKPEIDYPAEIKFIPRNTSEGVIIYLPEKIIVDGREYVNIRF